MWEETPHRSQELPLKRILFISKPVDKGKGSPAQTQPYLIDLVEWIFLLLRIGFKENSRWIFELL